MPNTAAFFGLSCRHSPRVRDVSSPVKKENRSLMNVPFVTGNQDLDAKFIEEAGKRGLKTLKGHRTVGGMRASIYNAMPIEGVKTLVEFMNEFEKQNT